jgi:hypothetical protein
VASCPRDLRRDWRRWSAVERIGAVSIVLAMVALTAATIIAAPA